MLPSALAARIVQQAGRNMRRALLSFEVCRVRGGRAGPHSGFLRQCLRLCLSLCMCLRQCLRLCLSLCMCLRLCLRLCLPACLPAHVKADTAGHHHADHPRPHPPPHPQVQQYPFQESQAVQGTDWEMYIAEVANDILAEQSPKKLYQVGPA